MLKNPYTNAIISLLVAVLMAPATSAGAASLAPHLAKYDLTLQGASDTTDIASISGLLVLEFSGASCTGYTNNVRIVTALDTENGDRLMTDIRAKTVESPDGRLEFVNQTYANGRRVEHSVGTAERGVEGVSVDLTEPLQHKLLLNAGLTFPTEHMVQILTAASLGKTFVAADVYDGSQDGELIYQTATIIGPERRDQVGDEMDEVMAENGFSGVPFWPVTISYFEKSELRADATPDFVVSYFLYENGVGRRIVIDYGDFSLRGRLRNLEMLPVPDCG